ncbi:MAG: uracil phosphoribosyltransferase [Spirochaetaceae bacterium]|jgi:uracil phosphoribosyltransferase|nr:uracil phosphoribosyltransferase [Spirochaetaceae bacterium]
MNNTITLTAPALDGYLTAEDNAALARIGTLYGAILYSTGDEQVRLYNNMGAELRELTNKEERIHVYAFHSPKEDYSEVSRIVAKLRDTRTENEEFIYYTQRTYEILFKFAYCDPKNTKLHYRTIKTPVTSPKQNYAVHRLVDIDDKIENTVMCVLLRGALLPSMIMSKEIQEYSSKDYITPFALFKISRDDSRLEADMRYILNLDKSYYDLESLKDKDLVFADPMNATGGSIITILKYLHDQGIKPRSIKVFNEIASLKGLLRLVRAVGNCAVYTMWVDPALNEKAYILPGLGDAGDRLNGRDEGLPKNMIQLISGYGTNIAGLYKAQVREIENTVLN